VSVYCKRVLISTDGTSQIKFIRYRSTVVVPLPTILQNMFRLLPRTLFAARPTAWSTTSVRSFSSTPQLLAVATKTKPLKAKPKVTKKPGAKLVSKSKYTDLSDCRRIYYVQILYVQLQILTLISYSCGRPNALSSKYSCSNFTSTIDFQVEGR